MYTLLRIARVFYEIRQVKRNHPVSSAVSLNYNKLFKSRDLKSEKVVLWKRPPKRRQNKNFSPRRHKREGVKLTKEALYMRQISCQLYYDSAVPTYQRVAEKTFRMLAPTSTFNGNVCGE